MNWIILYIFLYFGEIDIWPKDWPETSSYANVGFKDLQSLPRCIFFSLINPSTYAD